VQPRAALQRAQRREALQRANRVRSQRAGIKRQLADGELTFAELLAEPPTAIRTATIGSVLEWVPGIGHWRAGRILAQGPGSPGVGRGVLMGHLSEASKRRILARYETYVPFRYAPAG
jgi:hypothetical protein